MVEIERKRTFGSEDFSMDALTRPFVVVGIPAYNEERSIATIVLESQKFADAVIVCDDGSTDNTAVIARRIGADVIEHTRNVGYGAALKSLFTRALEMGADILVTLDGDGQHNPFEIADIVKPIIQNEADVVIGSRFVNNNGISEMPRYRQMGTKLITKMVNGSAKSDISDAQSGFRAYSREALNRLCIFESGMSASVEILLKADKNGLKVCEVPCTCRYDLDEVKTSTLNPLRHGMNVVGSVIRFVIEDRPLLYLGIPGALFLITGLFFAAWMLQIYASGGEIVTNIALAAVSFTLVAFLMLSSAMTLYAILRVSKKINAT
jgi:glycosyltransferase involved in cell wall biosynthesis